jgi:hypothetical protein
MAFQETDAAALIDALPGSMRKMQAATRGLAIDNN